MIILIGSSKAKHHILARFSLRTRAQTIFSLCNSAHPTTAADDVDIHRTHTTRSTTTIMADSTTAGVDIAQQYSLLPRLMPNLDRHLIYPLLNFSSDEDAEQPLEQKKLLLELLKTTNMTDFVGQLHQDVHGLDDMPEEFKQKRDQVLQRRDKLEEETSKISGLLDDENVVTNLRSDKVQNLAYLKDNHGVTVEMVNQLYEFGQFQYSCGVYPHAAELLYRFRVLVCTSLYL